MNRGTLIMVALALASLGSAVALRPTELPPPEDDDRGQPLLPEFGDPGLAARLEVRAWDPEASTVRPFAVELRGGRWLITSHHEYPADATERMGRAAASFVDVAREQVRTDDPAQHAEFGVEDPEDPEASDGGRGLRITIHDASGNPLVDAIVGREVPDRPTHRFIRLPDRPRVYACPLQLDLSTSFDDWIERDLMRIEASEVEGLISDPYRVNEAEGTIEGRSPISFVRGDLAQFVAKAMADANTDPPLPETAERPAAEWVTGPGIALSDAERPDQGAIDAIVEAVDGLQIVDVSPRPSTPTLEALQEKGFFMNTARRRFGNEGELTVINDDGVSYTLYFGEETGKAGRYMFVQVQYDPEMDRHVDPPADGQLRGKARAEELGARFDPWFFVIADDSFRAIHKTRDELLTDAP